MFVPRPCPERPGWPFVEYPIGGDAVWDLYLAWYLFDPGVSMEMEKCGHCQVAGDRDMVFRECVVPQDSAAGGACTNCLFRFEGVGCCHRLGAEETDRLRRWSRAELAAMSDEELNLWKRRILLEMYSRAMDDGLDAERCSEMLGRRGLM